MYFVVELLVRLVFRQAVEGSLRGSNCGCFRVEDLERFTSILIITLILILLASFCAAWFFLNRFLRQEVLRYREIETQVGSIARAQRIQEYRALRDRTGHRGDFYD